MKNRTLILSGIGLGLALSNAVQADYHNLDDLVVTAGLLPIESEKLGRAHTVLTGADLEKNQYRYVADALRTVPGLAVSRTGSFGGLTQVRVRGSEANHVLVLIDGIEAGATSQGEYDFGGLQVANIERIEVLRGPQSAFYGSNATSGVIHIITKGGTRNEHKFSAQTEVGTDSTLLTRLGYLGGGEDFDLSLSGSFRRTDGFNISSFGHEKDGDENTTWNGKANWDITADTSVNLSLRYVDRDSETNSQDFSSPSGAPTQGLVIDTDNYTQTRELYWALGLDQAFLDGAFVTKTRFEYTDTERRNYGTSSASGNNGRRNHLSHQGSYSFATPGFYNAKHSLTAALEGEREYYRNVFPSRASQIARQERSSFGYAAEYKGEFADRLFISAALRNDENSDFDDASTYSTSVAYLFPQTDTRLHGSYGKGITNPSFSEQFGFFPDSFIGNPDLEPEENKGWDLGIEQSFFAERLIVDLTFFKERLRNEIATNFAPPSFVASPINQEGVSKRRGVELSAQLDLTDQLYLTGSYTYLEATDPSGLEEVRRPMHTGALNLSYTFNSRTSFFVDAIYNGKTQDLEFVNATPESRVEMDDYVTVNIGGDYQINESVQVYGRIENLFDEDYQEVFSFNTPGVEGFVGLRATF